MKIILQFASVVALGTAVLNAQTTVDSSGDSMLNGAYRFRHVAVLNTDTNGNPTEVLGAFGVITFDGKGGYSVTGTYVDNTSNKGVQQALTATGTYVIGSNGTGYVSNPLAPTDSSNLLYGAVAQGAFTGSDTESGFEDDIFIAIPVGTPPTNASFTGTFWVGLLDFTGASSVAIKNALFKLTPNGSGGFGSISLTGQAANQTSSPTLTQTVTGGTYNFATDGNATLNIPLPSGVTATNALFSGAKSMYVSSNGNFVLGWTPSGYDIFFGVRALASSGSNSTLAGTYYTAGLEDAPTGNGTDSYFGSMSANGIGDVIVHQRLEIPGYYPYDSVSDDAIQVNADGTVGSPSSADFFGYYYALGASGNAFVGVGSQGNYALVVGTHAPNLSGSGVFLNPVGIVNAASYAPITASIAPGELLTLFGSGLSRTTLSASGGQPFQTSLGGVQVLMNGHPAPIFYVSSGQISAVVPYSLTLSSTQYVVTIQVNNNGTLSNPVTLYLTDALPGIFTQSQNGLGSAAALHATTGALVTPSNPAVAGEYLEIFLTGLGTVTPAISDGAVGPASPLSYADIYNSSNLVVFFDDYNSSKFQQATVSYAGLAPGLAGLYQLNVQVPTGVGPGNVYLEIGTDQADVNQVYVPVAASAGVNSRVPAAAAPSHRRPRPRRTAN